MNTPHIKPDGMPIAKTVLMPGDPLRAKFIAENFLENPVEFNSVRNILGYTGNYKGKPVSVMASGMGVPSMAIYSYELFKFFDVDNIIRIGTCGALQPTMKLYDVVIAMGAATDSNYASQYNLPGYLPPIASYELLSRAIGEIKGDQHAHVGNVLTSDFFYSADTTALDKWAAMGILAVDMETAALYWNATYLRKNALSILTVSDQIVTGEQATTEERQTAFTQMMNIALEVAIK